MTIYHFAQDPYRSCWFAGLPDAGECEGRMQACHLLPKSLIKRELWQSRKWRGRLPETLHELQWDPRVVVAGCQRHHFRLDESRKLKIPRYLLPPSVEEYAREYELMWWIEREYPDHGEAAA